MLGQIACRLKPQMPPLASAGVVADQRMRTEPICIRPNGVDDAATADNDMAADLMRHVGDAIDAWAIRYDLQNMPREFVFEQALALMNAYGNLLPDDDSPIIINPMRR